MKKIVLSAIMSAMLLSSVVTASAKTVNIKDDSSNTTAAITSNYTVFQPQTDNPTGW